MSAMDQFRTNERPPISQPTHSVMWGGLSTLIRSRLISQVDQVEPLVDQVDHVDQVEPRTGPVDPVEPLSDEADQRASE